MSTGPNGWKHVRCARENETAPVRQKLPGPVLFFLNYKPEYVPNTICKPGIYATFSDKKFSPFGRPIPGHLATDGAGLLGCLHLETVHSLAGLGDIQLIVVIVAHIRSLFSEKNADFAKCP